MADAAKREAKGCEDAGEADVDIGPGLSALAAKRGWRCSPKRTHAAPKATRPGNGQWGSANLACLEENRFHNRSADALSDPFPAPWVLGCGGCHTRH